MSTPSSTITTMNIALGGCDGCEVGMQRCSFRIARTSTAAAAAVAAAWHSMPSAHPLVCADFGTSTKHSKAGKWPFPWETSGAAPAASNRQERPCAAKPPRHLLALAPAKRQCQRCLTFFELSLLKALVVRCLLLGCIRFGLVIVRHVIVLILPTCVLVPLHLL